MIDDIKNEDPFLDDDLTEDDILLDDDLEDDLDGEWDDEQDKYAPDTAKPKSFLSKYFNVILIGSVAVLGSGFFYMKLSKPQPARPAPTQAQTSAQQQAPANNPALPPSGNQEEGVDLSNLRNAPIENEIALPYEQDIDNIQKQHEEEMLDAQGEENILPLDQLSEQDDFFSDIVIEEIEEGDVTNEAHQELIQAKADEQGEPLTPMPSMDSLEAVEDAAQEEALPEETSNATEESETAVVADDAVISLPEELTEDDSTAPADNMIADQAVTSATDDSQISALEEKIEALTQENIKLQDQLASKETMVKAATSRANALEEEIEDLQKAKPAQTTSASKPATKKIASTPKAITKPEPKATAPAKAQTQPQWTIRAAQPDRVTLYDSKSGNILRATIGETVRGLGKINSITYKDGNWFVVGSLKTVQTNF